MQRSIIEFIEHCSMIHWACLSRVMPVHGEAFPNKNDRDYRCVRKKCWKYSIHPLQVYNLLTEIINIFEVKICPFEWEDIKTS